MRRRFLVGLLVLVLGGALLPMGSASAAIESQEVVFRKITFPVKGQVSYSNSWMAARSGGARRHEGTDIMGRKLQVLLAAHDGTIGWSRTDGNNMLTIVDDDGWSYLYIHINNDTPGTDDGANPADWMFFPGIERGAEVTAGQPIAYMGDSGNAEGTSPHLHFELHQPEGVVVNAYWSLMLSQGRPVKDRCGFDQNPERVPDTLDAVTGGYWQMAADGNVFSYGGAQYHGAIAKRAAAPVIGLVASPVGSGYWQLTGDGGVFAFGDARFLGSVGGKRLNQPVVAMAATPSGNGYWLVSKDGGIFTFGDARYLGSTGGRKLSQPIIGMTATPSGNGYWLLARDGGVFAFGDAAFNGSAAGRTKAAVVDMASTATGLGYWIMTSAGTVLPFGDATWQGGVDHTGFCGNPEAVQLAPTPSGGGYWVQTTDGAVYPFGDAPDLGSLKRSGVATKSAVGLAAPSSLVPAATSAAR